ncbi:hypothetical protein [Streptosporangium saharense]|uniref:Uncharacterized protein n=1 Tax=Streptosporangium saharense TaxID=1706840 RepID=A0A7W7VKW8_9ACTN|nr:hypothetical protein [Streptosporangium saharense]MBB4913814.1 hypothetical protein [Streptosporangium saharense]
MSKPVILADLQAAFPGWTIWRSSTGRLWATRNRRLTGAQMEQGLEQTVSDEDVHQLVEQLRHQDRLAAEAG